LAAELAGGMERKEASLNTEFTEKKIKPRSAQRSKILRFARF